jgi:hypothetical protein
LQKKTCCLPLTAFGKISVCLDGFGFADIHLLIALASVFFCKFAVFDVGL